MNDKLVKDILENTKTVMSMGCTIAEKPNAYNDVFITEALKKSSR